jgi:integration host factor subunit alpha
MPPRRTMIKVAIVDYVAEHVDGLTLKQSAHIVEAVFELLKQTLVRGEKIKLSGFGNFMVRDKKERAGRNPRTGAVLRISGRRIVKFRPSEGLKKAMSG